MRFEKKKKKILNALDNEICLHEDTISDMYERKHSLISNYLKALRDKVKSCETDVQLWSLKDAVREDWAILDSRNPYSANTKARNIGLEILELRN